MTIEFVTLLIEKTWNGIRQICETFEYVWVVE